MNFNGQTLFAFHLIDKMLIKINSIQFKHNKSI